MIAADRPGRSVPDCDKAHALGQREAFPRHADRDLGRRRPADETVARPCRRVQEGHGLTDFDPGENRAGASVERAAVEVKADNAEPVLVLVLFGTGAPGIAPVSPVRVVIFVFLQLHAEVNAAASGDLHVIVPVRVLLKGDLFAFPVVRPCQRIAVRNLDLQRDRASLGRGVVAMDLFRSGEADDVLLRGFHPDDIVDRLFHFAGSFGYFLLLFPRRAFRHDVLFAFLVFHSAVNLPHRDRYIFRRYRIADQDGGAAGLQSPRNENVEVSFVVQDNAVLLGRTGILRIGNKQVALS